MDMKGFRKIVAALDFRFPRISTPEIQKAPIECIDRLGQRSFQLPRPFHRSIQSYQVRGLSIAVGSFLDCASLHDPAHHVAEIHSPRVMNRVHRATSFQKRCPTAVSMHLHPLCHPGRSTNESYNHL